MSTSLVGHSPPKEIRHALFGARIHFRKFRSFLFLATPRSRKYPGGPAQSLSSLAHMAILVAIIRFLASTNSKVTGLKSTLLPGSEHAPCHFPPLEPRTG